MNRPQRAGGETGRHPTDAAGLVPPVPVTSTSLVSRRSFLRSAGSIAAASLTGCATGLKLRKCEIAKDLPFPDLVAHLNRNIDQINSWRCNDVSMKSRGGPLLVPTLSANICIERPRNFRLQGTVLNSNVVDLGSNDERFWVWVKNNEEPGIITARHDCLRAAQQHLPLPFDPDWLIEAMGVIPFEESEIEFERHQSDPKKCFFKRKRKAADGTRLTMVSIIDTCLGVVDSHSLEDRNHNIIALTRMSEYERDGKTGVVLPHTVDLSWPQGRLGLTLRMGAITVNPVTLSSTQFDMPQMANCPVHDIGGETEHASGEVGRSSI